jgi:hypothetical protein
MSWVHGWQGGLFLGTALVVVIEVFVRWLLFKLQHRRHGHCRDCDGCMGDDGRALFPSERLLVCDNCGDTRPGPCWWTALDMEARDRAVALAEEALNDGGSGALAGVLAGHVYWLTMKLDRLTPSSPARAKSIVAAALANIHGGS